jgi:hypothetical protein
MFLRPEWMLRLYPRGWQARYAEEMAAVIQQHQVTPSTYIDLCLSAIDAHLDPSSWGQRKLPNMDNAKRLRNSTSMILFTFIAFVLTYIIFLSDFGDIFDGVPPNAFQAALNGIENRVFNFPIYTILITILILAFALVFTAKTTTQRALRWIPLVLEFFTAVIFLVHTGNCAHPTPESCPNNYGAIVLALFFLSTLVAAIFVWRSEISQTILRITLIPLTLVSLGMLVVVIQEIDWAVSVWGYDQAVVQQMAKLADQTLWMGGDWHIGFLVGVIVMTFFGILSIWSLIVSLPALKNQTGPNSRL